MVKKAVNYIISQKALLAFIILFIIASIVFDRFLTPLNIKNIFRQVSITGLVAIGMTVVLISGGIDLSVGSIAAVTSITAAYLSGGPVIVTVLVSIVIGLVFGFANGLIITKIKIPPFIATLATMLAGRGIAHLLSNSETVRAENLNPAFSQIARGSILNVPYLGIIFTVILILSALFMKYKSFGRRLYAVGGSEEASSMMGLKTDNVKIMAYMICGTLAGFAGMLLVARLGSGQPYAGSGWELTAISAAVIGGVSTNGGKGTVTGTLFGILILGIITNMINLFGGLPYWYANLVTAILLLIVIMLQSKISFKTAGGEA